MPTSDTDTFAQPPETTATARPDRGARRPPADLAPRICTPVIQPQQAPMAEPLGFEAFRSLDRMSEAAIGQLTGGLSPAAAMLAISDWALHLAAAPGKRMELGYKAARKSARLMTHLLASAADVAAAPAILPLPGDNRFRHESWQRPPFSWLAQGFLFQQQWWHNATHEVPGMTEHHTDIISFAARQILDMFSPSNNPFTNPEIIARTVATNGMNFVQGWRNWLDDVTRQATGRPPAGAENFRPGIEVAATPGKVVYRNHLIELIQYEPATGKVHPEPVLIVPAWIMKYYILDLSPENSLIRWLVAQGHTVFAISWRNPDAEDRDLSMQDYHRLGVMAALDAVSTILPGRRIHATGYCLGGTLLAIAAASMAQARDARLATLTLLAAQVDFSEPGELGLFIDSSQLHFLQSMMWNRGYLSAGQMGGAFQMLRSNDLIWSRVVRDYLMGERTPMIDMMAWNADSTRMPYRMHAEYLQRLYLDNELASGRFLVEGRPAILQNIRAPIFAVGTERDHVAPWPSVYKIHHVTDTEVTFVLTSGGHNAGIVSEPGHPHRHYRIHSCRLGDCLPMACDWHQAQEPRQGSWWPAWHDWLISHDGDELVDPPTMGAPDRGLPPLCDAPGTYVLQH